MIFISQAELEANITVFEIFSNLVMQVKLIFSHIVNRSLKKVILDSADFSYFNTIFPFLYMLYNVNTPT